MDEDTVKLTPQLNFLTNSIRGSGTWIIQRRRYPSRQLLVTRSIFLSLPFHSPSLSPRLCAFLSNICNMKGIFFYLFQVSGFFWAYILIAIRRISGDFSPRLNTRGGAGCPI